MLIRFQNSESDSLPVDPTARGESCLLRENWFLYPTLLIDKVESALLPGVLAQNLIH